MTRLVCFVALAAGLALTLPANAKALVIAAPPVPVRVASVDAVVLGKVTEIETKDLVGELFDGDMRLMRVARVKVTDRLTGKTSGEIRVGFFPPAPRPGRPGLVLSGGGRSPQLEPDQEACLFLKKHPKHKDVYVAPMYYDIVTRKDNPNFANELTEIKKAARVLINPVAALKARDEKDRFMAAAMLITRYRTAPKMGMARTEPVDAVESKLILEALAEADWNVRNPHLFTMSPVLMFSRLGLTATDGWTPPATGARDGGAAAKKWLKDHAATYRIQRFVGTKIDVDPAEPPG